MRNNIKLLIQLFLIGTIGIFFQACSLKVPLKSTTESENIYEPISDEKMKKEVSFIDLRSKNSAIVKGIFKNNLHLKYQKKDLDGLSFIKEALKKEFLARDLPIEIVDLSKESLNLEKFEVFTYRSTSFSPLVTISSLRITVKINNIEKTFSSIIKRGKVPIWSFDEVFDPCFNEPLSLMIKEIVAKINKAYFGYKISDKNISKIISKIENGVKIKDKLNYLNVYELGFSNNQKALDSLKSYTTDDDEYLRLASLSTLGLLGGESEFNYLVEKYRNSRIWQDRALSLKSISDINIENARKFLRNEYKFWKLQDSKEAKWNVMLLDILIK